MEEELLEDIYVKIDKKESIIKEERFRKLLEVFKDFDSIFGKVLFLNCFSIFLRRRVNVREFFSDRLDW